ncbi:protein kinase [Geminocystis sp. GBBB08]|uniref:protein kinase n=1 Tax=Geminocystis sp. GBBB08 TaxID=2604140 RepID=UPI0027E2F0BE|nr:protein kinase [Geminocystis sp. GBBB08]MBL1209368.1 protein kinase [Geminocystis sp. GBBB08]
MSSIILDRYEIITELGAGGFGETFLAKDLQMPSRKEMVIKCIKPINEQTSSEILEELFKREASTLEQLGAHCNQIPTLYAYSLYAYFVLEGKFYLVQEYIEGKNLAQLGVISQEQCLIICKRSGGNEMW